MHRTIIVGSPRENGRSASLASQIFDACIEDCPDDSLSVVSVSGMDIAGCTGCDGCKKSRVKRSLDVSDNNASEDAEKDVDGSVGVDASVDAGSGESASENTVAENIAEDEDFRLDQNVFVAKSNAWDHICVIDDDMNAVREHVDAADELIVVCPVYFASAPSQMKALMDRMQPYYWSNLRNLEKRPMTLHIVGEGGDPYGFDCLITGIRSAFGVAGFELVSVLDWVGCIDAKGEIMLDAEELLIDG